MEIDHVNELLGEMLSFLCKISSEIECSMAFYDIYD